MIFLVNSFVVVIEVRGPFSSLLLTFLDLSFYQKTEHLLCSTHGNCSTPNCWNFEHSSDIPATPSYF